VLLLVNVLDHHHKLFTGTLLLVGVVMVLGSTTLCIFCAEYKNVTLLKKYVSEFSETLMMNTKLQATGHCLFNIFPND
jgi:hypothetical protein